MFPTFLKIWTTKETTKRLTLHTTTSSPSGLAVNQTSACAVNSSVANTLFMTTHFVLRYRSSVSINHYYLFKCKPLILEFNMHVCQCPLYDSIFKTEREKNQLDLAPMSWWRNQMPNAAGTTIVALFTSYTASLTFYHLITFLPKYIVDFLELQ